MMSKALGVERRPAVRIWNGLSELCQVRLLSLSHCVLYNSLECSAFGVLPIS